MVLSYKLDITTLSNIDKERFNILWYLHLLLQICISYSNCILEATVVLRMCSQFDKKIDITLLCRIITTIHSCFV